VVQEVSTLPEHLTSPPLLVVFVCCLILSFLCSVLQIVVCPFLISLLAIVLSVLHRFTDFDYLYGIFKLFLQVTLYQHEFYQRSEADFRDTVTLVRMGWSESE